MIKRALPVVAAGLIVTSALVVARAASLNDGAVAPLLLLAVVVIARIWRLGPALLAAAISAGGYLYFFLPPEGHRIEDPSDWTAFITFTVTAVIASELAVRAEQRAEEAQQGRVEIERLYHELEAAFDRASEAEAARRNEQLKAALLDALTHNLRTPLTAIKASVTALMHVEAWSAEPQLSSESSRDLLQVIDEESDRLNRFIEGLTTAAPSETPAPALRSVPVGDIVAAGLSRAETVTRNHRVSAALDEDLPAVSADPAAITEALYILLDNASKYADAGTAIRLHASMFDDRFVRISVGDEGPGIAPDLRERVFEKFFRIPAREPNDPRRKGVGLGLPIARRLVEAQSGRLWIETPASGRGTTFVIALPLAIEPLAAAAAPARATAD